MPRDLELEDLLLDVGLNIKLAAPSEICLTARHILKKPSRNVPKQKDGFKAVMWSLGVVRYGTVTRSLLTHWKNLVRLSNCLLCSYY